jgi:rare lipoprotein A
MIIPRTFLSLNVLALSVILAGSCFASATPVKKKASESTTSNNTKQFSGNASWYGIPFHGRKTASGEIFNMNKLTAAHLRLPFFTRVLVESPRTGKSVVVKVNDRGPYVKTRVMDMSREAARRLGTINSGVAYVECTVLDDDDDDSNGK